MKMLSKLKKYIFAFCLTLVSVFSYSVFKDNYVNATELSNGITYNEGDTYVDASGNRYVYFIGKNSDSSLLSALYYNTGTTANSYRFYPVCSYSVSGTTASITCTEDRYSGNFGSLGSVTQNALVSTWDINSGNYGEFTMRNLNDSGVWNMSLINKISNSYYDGYEDGYDDGYNNGTINGLNMDFTPDSCYVYYDNVTYQCNSIQGNNLDGVLSLDDLNDEIGDLYPDTYDVVLTFNDLLSYRFPIYLYYNSKTGVSVEFYNNDTLIYTAINNGDDYYELVDFRSLGITDSYNKIIIRNTSYIHSLYSITRINPASLETGEFIGGIESYDRGFFDGEIFGYNKGYDDGYYDNSTLVAMVGAIFTGPVTMFQQIFNFNVLGVNLAGMLLGLVTLLVVIWLIKKFI